MTGSLTPSLRHVILGFSSAILFSTLSFGHDLGTNGDIFPIQEVNIKSLIKKQGEQVNWNAVGNKLKKSARKYLNDLPNQTSTINSENKTVYYDPSIKMNRDIRTTTGQLIYKKNTWFNPLWKTRDIFAPNMLFIDGEDKEQVNFALSVLKKHKNELWIVFTNGRPTDLAKRIHTPVYYANSPMVQKFHIQSVPTMIGLGVGNYYYRIMQMRFSKPYYKGLVDTCWHGCSDKAIQSYIQTHSEKGGDHV